jgi:hypothetical protein
MTGQYLVADHRNLLGPIPNRRHETVGIEPPWGGGKVHIDKSIAPLIAAMWERRWETLMSCEDSSPQDYVWLMLVECSARAFLSFIACWAEGENDDIARSAKYPVKTEHPDLVTGPERPWLIKEPAEWVPGFTTVCVRFPREHLKLVTELLCSARRSETAFRPGDVGAFGFHRVFGGP